MRWIDGTLHYLKNRTTFSTLVFNVWMSKPNFFMQTNRLSIHQWIWVSLIVPIIIIIPVTHRKELQNAQLHLCCSRLLCFFILIPPFWSPWTPLWLWWFCSHNSTLRWLQQGALHTCITFKTSCLLPLECSFSGFAGFGHERVERTYPGLVTKSHSSSFRSIYCVSIRDIRLSRLPLVFFLPKKMKHVELWEKTFYCSNRILLVGFSQKISKKFFQRPIFSHAGCREVVSGTVRWWAIFVA